MDDSDFAKSTCFQGKRKEEDCIINIQSGFKQNKSDKNIGKLCIG